MSRFARVTEEVVLRHKELAVENRPGKMGRSALETLFLYTVILLHSWETGICKRTITQLCEIYGLEYHNSTRRLKILRRKGWIEDTKKHIRPLLIHKSDDEKDAKKSVIITPFEVQESVTVTLFNNEKSVTVTPEKCNSYTKTDEKSVTVTPKNAVTPIPQKTNGDSKTLLNLKTRLDHNNNRENPDVVVDVVGKKILSKFSLEDCRRYVKFSIENGQFVKNPEGLAITLHQSGEADVFIRAALYPPPAEEPAAEQSIEYDDEYLPPEPLDERVLQSRLWDLQALEPDESELREQEILYTPEDWQWLMERRRK